jgi:RNA polymerase sigma-70 factor (ECF subfamily)
MVIGEEVAMEVFVQAHGAIQRFKGCSSVRTWIFSIARKQCSKYEEKVERRKRIESGFRPDDTFLARIHREPPPTSEQYLLEQEKIECLRQSLAKLRTKERKLLMMIYYEGLSVTDIARRSLLSWGAIRNRVCRAQKELRLLMDQC